MLLRRITDLLRLDFLLGIFSGVFLTIAVLLYIGQFDLGANADWLFPLVPLMVSGAFSWLAERLSRRSDPPSENCIDSAGGQNRISEQAHGDHGRDDTRTLNLDDFCHRNEDISTDG
jgi:hypothetical protein